MAETQQSMAPNDALRALGVAVEQLAVVHPRRAGAMVDPKLDLQLPWICRTLEEAASAFETGFDPFENPITNTQVLSGLGKLTEMVRDPAYLSAMEMGHPGIAAGLEHCMDQLASWVQGAPKISAPSSSKGVETLVGLFTELGILFPDQHVSQAVEELKAEGEPGSDALAVLIRELLACRSPKITVALEVARKVVPTLDLIDAVRAVAHASELAEAPAHPRFTPEIAGDGRCGWTSGSYAVVVDSAFLTQERLEELV